MSILYFLERRFNVACECCGDQKVDCRPFWVDPSKLRLVCSDCVGFILPLIRELGVETKKGGD